MVNMSLWGRYVEYFCAFCFSITSPLQSDFTMFFLQVEAALSVSPYVDNIMMHADPFHSYCVALVVPAQQALENWASTQGITYNDFSDLCQKQEAVKEVQGSLVKVCIFRCCLCSLHNHFHITLFR